MAITIDWPVAVININQVDMVLIQSEPTIVYQLDMESFRLTLKDLEDDFQGINWPVTHSRNAPVTISGAILAQVIEILPPYTVSFEETGTPYRVNVVGANTNIGERTNLNSGEVSVSTSNSAGLQDLNSLQAASFGGEVSININSSFSGTTFPIGTRANPVNNIADAHAIADKRGIASFRVMSSMTLTSEDVSDAHIFLGNTAGTMLTLDAGADVSNCTFERLNITGTLDNANIVRNCSIGNITNINGFINNSILTGTLTLGGGNKTSVFNTASGIAGDGAVPTIDCGGSGQELVVRGYEGALKITNRTGTDDISLDFDSGELLIDSTVTAGMIKVRGAVKVINNGTGTSTIDTTGVLPFEGTIADAVWNEAIADHTSAGSTGEALDNVSAGASPAAIADAVWDEAEADHDTAGSTGEQMDKQLKKIKQAIAMSLIKG